MEEGEIILDDKSKVEKVTGVRITIDTNFLNKFREEFQEKSSSFPNAEYNDIIITIDNETRKFTFEEFKNRLFNMATL